MHSACSRFRLASVLLIRLRSRFKEVGVAEWHQKWQGARPRWGTFSVKAHTELQRLITDLLLYDVLVFPCPSDDQDFEGWKME